MTTSITKEIFFANAKINFNLLSLRVGPMRWLKMILIGLCIGFVLISCADDSNRSSTETTDNKSSAARLAVLEQRLLGRGAESTTKSSSEASIPESCQTAWMALDKKYSQNSDETDEEEYWEDEEEWDDELMPISCVQNQDGSVTENYEDGSTVTVMLSEQNGTFSYSEIMADANGKEVERLVFESQADGSFQETETFAEGEIQSITTTGQFSEETCQAEETITYRDGRTETNQINSCYEEEFEDEGYENVTSITESDGSVVTTGSWKSEDGSESSTFKITEKPDGSETIAGTYQDAEGTTILDMQIQADGSGSGTLTENGVAYQIVLNADDTGTITDPDGNVESF